MILIATYCSRDKAADPGKLPAIDRYLSRRIQAVYRAAISVGAEFRILSGKYGLLKASSEIPHYDLLLTSADVPRMSARIAEQILQIEPTCAIFCSRTVEQDPQVRPYRTAFSAACSMAGVEFTVVDMPENEMRAESIAELIKKFLPS